MAVSNGQNVDQTVTNAAFVSRTQNSNTIGRLDLEKPTGSGPSVIDVQLNINDLKTAVVPIPQLVLDVADHESRIDAIELDLPNKIDVSEKGQPNGVAELDVAGKVPVAQLPTSVTTARRLLGTWDGSTNTPTLADGIGTQGDEYYVNVGGTQDFGSGPITFTIGDFVHYNGTVWIKLEGGQVESINGLQGVVVLDLDDIDDVDAPTPSNGDVLKFDGVDWVNEQNTVGNLVDVDLAGLSNGDTLKYNSVSMKWENGPAATDSFKNDNVTTGSNATLDAFTQTVVRLSNASLVSLEMIPAGVGGQRLVLINQTGDAIDILNNTGATAANRILTGLKATLNIQDEASVFLTYDSTESRWMVVGGSGGGAVGYQEDLAGAVNGINTTFGPLTFNPVNDESIIVYVDGLVLRESEWSRSGSNIVLTTAPIAGQKVFVFYLRNGVASPAPVISGIWKTEYRTISGGEATAKQLTLAQTPASGTEVMLDVIGGGAQFYGDDFTVTGTTLSWSGLGLDGVLGSGDKVRIGYVY